MSSPDPERAGLAMKRLHDALRMEDAGRLDEARLLGEQALQAFAEAGDRTGRAAAHQLLAQVLAATGAHGEALAHVEAALPLRAETGDQQGLAALHQGRFELALALGRPQLMRRAAEDLLTLVRRAGDRDGEARARHQLATLLLDHGAVEDAAAEVAEGLRCCDQVGEERARAAFAMLSARVEARRGRMDAALDLGEQALALARASQRRMVVLDAMGALAELEIAAGLHARARERLEALLDEREVIRDLPGRAEALLTLGHLEQAMGLPRQALDRLDHAARTRAELGQAEQAAELLHAAAELAASLEAGERALSLSARQIEAAAASGQEALHAAAWHVHAGRLVAAGRLAEAAEAFEAAAGARARAGQPEAEAVARGMLAQVLAALGRRAEARATLLEAREVLRALGSEALPEVEALLVELGA